MAYEKKFLMYPDPVSPVSLTAPTCNFQSQFKRQILVANWKNFPASLTDKEVF